MEKVKDTISRQAAYDALMAEPLKWDDSSVWESARCYQWMMDMDVIKALPPAPEHKKGQWNIYYRTHWRDTFICNRCGSCFIVVQGEDRMNFCPYCGSDNRG